jgi:cell division protein FtsI (penicillin-binding protein 3)
MAQAPTVNSSRPGRTKPADRGIRAVSDPYEPGSVQKILTSAALIDAGLVDPDTRVTVPNRLPSGAGTIKDHFEHGTERFTMRGIVANSSNIGMVMLARQMPKQKLLAYLKRFGLGSTTGVELPIESAGIVPGSDLQDLTRDQLAFGQALAVTGIQQSAAIAGLINGGVYRPPTVLKAATTSTGASVELPAKQPRRLVSSRTSRQVRDLMRAVVDTDNGQRNLALAGYQTGGKTGTAERADSRCGCYKGYVTSYVGFAPYDDPQILTYVVINNPRKGETGTGVAAPVYKDIMQFALPRYSVPPDSRQTKAKPTEW